MNEKIAYTFIAIIAFVMLTASDCKHENKTTTKIKRDGSCERTVVVGSVKDTVSPIPIYKDTTWNVHVEGDSEKVYVASKKFDDVNQMNNEYRDPDKFGIDIRFEKKFRWFYTYFNYQETYKAFFPFHRIPIKTFLTAHEYAQYEKGDTSNALKKRLEEFLTINAREEYYAQLVDSAETLQDPLLPVALFRAKKQEIVNGMVDIEHNEDVVKFLEKTLGLKLKGKLERQMESIQKSIDAKVKFMIEGNGNYINEVVMPGIILNTNASTIEGNKVSWKFDDDRFIVIDYTMTVESRVANLWAMYVTGGLVVVLVGLLMLPRLKRNNHKDMKRL